MNVYTNPLSATSQFSFCGLPFRLDTYSGCAFSCSYCFARLRGGNIPVKKLRTCNPNFVISRFKNSFERETNNGLISQYIRRMMPVHFGGMSDPFQPAEKHFQTSLSVLRYLVEKKYPTVISTRSTLVAEDPYLALLKESKNIVVQFSFSTLNDGVAKQVEPFTPSPKDLLNTVEKLSSNGIITTLRWQPYIPFLSEKPEDFVSKISSLGIRHLGFEHLKLPLERNNHLVERVRSLTKFDLLSEYKSHGSKIDGRELILPSHFKIDMIQRVKKLANKLGMTFGAADNELQYLSDTDCCCSGVDQFSGFENWNRFQIGFAIKKSLGRDISYQSIADEWRPSGSIDKHLNSKSRIPKNRKKSNSVEEYLINRWQNLQSPFNPVKYHGVVFKNRTDSKGMNVFEWDDQAKRISVE